MMSLDIGAARLNIISLGDLNYSLSMIMAVNEAEWRARNGALFEQRLAFPSQTVLVAVDGKSILVDAGDYQRFAKEAPEYVDPKYSPPAGLTDQLQALGVSREEVSHVIITHAHYDHYSGVTTDKGESIVPAFPQARHFLGKGDWDWEEIRKAMANPSSNESKTLGVVNRLGFLELVIGDKELARGVEIVSAPGESPGHQVLRVRSGGETAYCVGDLFHHWVEIENPGWMATWCDPTSNLRSRKMVLESALKENAILIPSHMPPGRIEKSGERYSYNYLS